MNNEELVLLYQQGDKQALASLIEKNAGIVRKIANKFYGINKTIEFDDMIQVGFIGLINAANKYNFDMENKASFITFAFTIIKQEILSCVNGRSSKDVENNKFYNSCLRLDAPIKEDTEINLKDTLKDVEQSFENIEEKLYLKQLREDLESVMLENTTLREREVLKLHYGWECKKCSFIYIGSIFEVSDSRVQQIEHMALRKIRQTKWAKLEYKKHYRSIKHNYNTVENKIDFADKYFKGVI
ncbi:sigma-70 family RNA polymerase sigma factor [Clostridium botulinum]|uniref:sigma-70 family RNA polymerase sigma factor n=1 Tax=Clostridium botulinum TaxID=1491 RepID=UPI0013FE965E|nr:sigma-70 family RNA polymerase sigma factor [Clostridium botulinum]MBY6836270.1 sigma-70 family RNA polymerase sigma factor [Clostridium botulinum]NFG63668.1 sigma-70 family RNA polymerase sigma factor [Clostridium botulinum]NFQ22887.1 sigma-70 family RNA polymerase sigma factor [Clostridium botulinum]